MCLAFAQCFYKTHCGKRNYFISIAKLLIALLVPLMANAQQQQHIEQLEKRLAAIEAKLLDR